MSLETLKKLRMLVPGIIVLLFWALLGHLTGDWNVKVPESVADLAKTLPAIIVAVIYYITPLRDWANRKNHVDVNYNIRVGLTNIGGGDLESGISDWPNIKHLFYQIVDSDESLKVQSKRAYFNGLIWTSVADVKAVSIVFILISLVYGIAYNSQGALIGVAVFVVIAVVTLPISWKITEIHRNIGDEQLAKIRRFHSVKVKAYFENE